MLKLRTIGIRDYRVLEGRQRIGRIRFADERMPGVWLWSVPTRQPPDGLLHGPRHGQGGVQGGLGSAESQDHAGATRLGLQGNEHPRRRLIREAAAIIPIKSPLSFPIPAPNDGLIQLRAPRRLIIAIKQGAAEEGLTPSAFIRVAVTERLRRAGIRA